MSTEIHENNMSFTETEVGNLDTKVLVWHWYRIGQYETTSPYIAKAISAYNLIVKGRKDASMITVSTRLDEDINQSKQRIADFIHDASADINRQLEQLTSE
jgi:EpsI family protein